MMQKNRSFWSRCIWRNRANGWTVIAAVAGLCCVVSPATLYAAPSDLVTASGGKDIFAVEFLDEDQVTGDETASVYTLSDATKKGVLEGLAYWAELLGDQAKNQKPIQVLVMTNDVANAFAEINCGTGAILTNDLFLNQALQNGKKLENVDFYGAKPQGPWAFADITFGKYLGAKRGDTQFGWYLDAETVLPRNEQASDFIGTVRHEMGHALGIAASHLSSDAFDEEGNELCFFENEISDPLSWSAHLMDQNGNFAKPGMAIVTSTEFERQKEKNEKLRESDFFIVDNLNDTAPDMSDTENPKVGNVYFVGKNVTTVLDGALFDGVSGLPVNAWEIYEQGKSYPEFSHLQTTGMMSHRTYSNYTSFMEVELAVMQDMGYGIDRKNYFGYSVYDNGVDLVNENGYSARNEAGTAYLPGVYSATPLGVGLHVYGSYNKITQAADIWTVGAGAVGARIDGEENTIRISEDTQVRSDGKRGIGLLVSYGKNHTLTQAGTVTADGEGGIGVCFDFGSSSNGAVDEYRGSYIRYHRSIDDNGKIVNSMNLEFGRYSNSFPATPELNGPLVTDYALSGYLSGHEQAIYISKNAFVQKIDILNGAFIRGDITSDWKHFANDEQIYDGSNSADKLAIRYNKNLYTYDKYIPELVTDLSFNANLAYNGAINGADNMKLRVENGALHYGGTADVVAVTVADGAELLGGSYRVNDMSEHLHSDFTDNEMGKFINHGVIGAATPMGADTSMKIDGDLQSDGIIQFTANREHIGYIDVNGAADISGSCVRVDENGIYLPNNTYDENIVRIQQRSAVVGSFDGMEPYQSGMMGAQLLEGSGIRFYSADHLGARNQVQQKMYEVVDGSLTRNPSLNYAYAELYSLPSDAAKRALGDLHGGLQADMATAVKLDRFLPDAVYDRLAEDNRDDGLWAVMKKGWNRLDSNASLPQMKEQSFHIAVGQDRSLGENWTAGALFAYGKHDVASGAGSGETHDYRLGMYGGYEADAVAVDTYLFYGRQNNDATRHIGDLGLTARSDYHGDIVGAGVKVSRDLRYKSGSDWQIRPYVALDAAHYRQDAYAERGAGAFSQYVDGYSDNVVTTGLGIEAIRKLGDKGSYTIGAGYRRLLAGEESLPTARLAADTSFAFDAYGNSADKDVFVLRAKGETIVHDGFCISGELTQELGKNTNNLSAALKAVWEF